MLQSLDADLLAQKACFFAGGTAITLRYGEYRESVDIDFLVSDISGYRNLRQLLTGAEGIKAIAKEGSDLTALRDIRGDQYGIRTVIRMDETFIKFEIVLEGRVKLEVPGRDETICGIATITPLDMMTTKLLANSDRWADDAVFSRDLIDIAMMNSAKLLPVAIDKASEAYGLCIRRDLDVAIDHLLHREGWMERCIKAMKMNVPKALLWQNVRKLTAANKPI